MKYNIQSMVDPVINFGKVTVSTGYSDTDPVIVLVEDDGAKLPDPLTDGGPYNLVWYNWTDYPDPSDDLNREIVRVNDKDGDILTITRAQEGTGVVPDEQGNPHNMAGKTYKMILSLTAKMIPDIQTDAQTRVNSHAVSTVSVHNFDASGNSPAQTHGNERHTEAYITAAQAVNIGDIFGNGSDGNVTISTTTTLTSDQNYNNLTINPGVVLYTNGYVVRIRNTLTLNGTIHCNGRTIGQKYGFSNNSYSVHGGGASGSGAVYGGAAATAGESSAFGLGGNGGAGGGREGSSGAAGGTITNRLRIGSYLEVSLLMSNFTRFFGGAGGGGSGLSWELGGGFAGGSGGGVLLLYANNIVYGPGGLMSADGGGGCCGGEAPGSGGGGGGFVCVVYHTGYDNARSTANGGAGSVGTQGPGQNGTAGQIVAFMV